MTGSGNPNVLVTERGASFGYNTLVSDMRALPIMAEIGAPVIFDATHSVQQPGGQGGSTGGERRFVETLARAAVAVGVAGVFIETHQDPDNAPSDGPNMVPLKDMPALLERLLAFDRDREGMSRRSCLSGAMLRRVIRVASGRKKYSEEEVPCPSPASPKSPRRRRRAFRTPSRRASTRATKTLKNVEGAWIQDQKIVVEDGKISAYRVNMKVTFILTD